MCGKQKQNLPDVLKMNSSKNPVKKKKENQSLGSGGVHL